MIVFILGGVKGGKSMFAQCTAKYLSEKEKLDLYYIATMIAYDTEDEKRIQRHISDRDGWGFTTFEEKYNLTNLCEHIDEKSCVLLDSITALVQNNMFCDNPNKIISDPYTIFNGIKAISEKAKYTVIVSDYIFSDAVKYSQSVYDYLKVFSKVHTLIAQDADTVIECAYSNMKFWKISEEIEWKKIKQKYYSLGSHLNYFDI